MTETTTPFDGGPVMMEAAWTQLWASTLGDGVLDMTQRNDGTFAALETYTDADGRQVKVRAGSAHVRGHLYTNDSTIVVPIAANASGFTRLDRIVLRLDVLAKRANVIPLTGTPGSATPPILTQIVGGFWDIPLSVISVASGFANIPLTPGSGTTASFISNNRIFTCNGTSPWQTWNPGLTVDNGGGGVSTLVNFQWGATETIRWRLISTGEIEVAADGAAKLWGTQAFCGLVFRLPVFIAPLNTWSGATYYGGRWSASWQNDLARTGTGGGAPGNFLSVFPYTAQSPGSAYQGSWPVSDSYTWFHLTGTYQMSGC